VRSKVGLTALTLSEVGK